MKVAELGEFGLIEHLTTLLPKDVPGLLAGVWEDAAAWRIEDGVALATTDTLVEGVHFRLDLCSWFELGWKALAVNLSDIAAMGGIPQYALVTLAVPPAAEVERLQELYQGLAAAGEEYHTAVVGGDMVSSPTSLVVSVALFGRAAPVPRGSDYALLRRSAAQPGELIGVTGWLGSSAAGLRMLLRGLPLGAEAEAALRRAHLRPQPRLREGQLLLASGVRAAIDVSDGVAGDLRHLCAASGVGAKIYAHKLPVHPLVRQAFAAEALNLALYGGEDYELLFTAPPQAMEKAQRALPEACGTPVGVIGEIMAAPEGRIVLVHEDGAEGVLERGGYDHFRG